MILQESMVSHKSKKKLTQLKMNLLLSDRLTFGLKFQQSLEAKTFNHLFTLSMQDKLKIPIRLASILFALEPSLKILKVFTWFYSILTSINTQNLMIRSIPKNFSKTWALSIESITILTVKLIR